MKFSEFMMSPEINKLGLWIGENTNPVLGRWIAKRISGAMSYRRKNESVRAVRANQWVIRGKTNSTRELNLAVKNVYLSSGHSLYDYYHNMRNPEAIKEMIVFDDHFLEFMEQSKAKIKGSLGLLLHMGGFDLAGYAIALRGMEPQILSYPQPNLGYQWHNELRKREGLNITPLSMETLTQASRFLKNKGTVITGIDRPWHETRHHPRFFGEESAIPVTTIQLAIRTQVPVVVIACIRQKDGHYILHGSEFINMDSYKDRDEELIRNTEKILERAEPFILQAPEQWSMYYPVWPQFVKDVL